jgi:hypothetical protein
MEIFTDLGVAAEIYERGTPPEHMRYSAYYVGFVGPDAAFGRQLFLSRNAGFSISMLEVPDSPEVEKCR